MRQLAVGAVDFAEVDFGFEMQVVRLKETPRITRPYAPEDWQAINAAGNAIEVAESVEVLAGGGPADVVELTVALARESSDDHPAVTTDVPG